MIAIRDFPHYFDARVNCLCRVYGTRTVWNEEYGRLNHQVHLSDFSGEACVLTAPVTPNAYPVPHAGMIILADVQPRSLGQNLGGLLRAWRPVEDVDNIARVFPRAQCPAAAQPYLGEMVELVDRMTTPEAKRCLTDVLKNCWPQFLTAMGGWRYHHNYAGGLFAHSVSVALLAEETARRIHTHDTARVDIVIVAALLHDLGKALQIQKGPSDCATASLRHETITLPMTFDAINRMGRTWSDGAERLTAILEWLATPTAQRRQFPDAQIVHSADATDVMIDRARSGRLDHAA